MLPFGPRQGRATDATAPRRYSSPRWPSRSQTLRGQCWPRRTRQSAPRRTRQRSKPSWRTGAIVLPARRRRGLLPLVDCSHGSRKILLLRLELLLADIAPRVTLPEDVERCVGSVRFPALGHQPANPQHEADNDHAPEDQHHQHHPDPPHPPHSPHRVHARPPPVWTVLRRGQSGPQPWNDPDECALCLSHVLVLLLVSLRQYQPTPSRSDPGPPRRHLGLLHEHGHEGPGSRRESARFAVDGVKVPADAQPPEPDGGQATTGHLAPHRVHRDEGNAEAGHYRLLDGLGVVELHADPPAHPRPLERALGDLPGGRALLAHQQRLLGKACRSHLPGLRPGMAPAHHQHQLVDETRRQAFFPGREPVPTHDREIQLVRADRLFHHPRVGDPESQLDARIPAAEPADESGQYIDARCRAGADQQRAALQAVELPDRLADVGQGREDALGTLLEHAARLGQGDPPSEPVEEPRAELPLELPDVLGEGGLTRVQGLGRAPIPLGPGDGEEYLELTERHGGKSSLIGPVRKRYWRLSPRPRKSAPSEPPHGRAAGRPLMIFRQFLAPKTGCASYLFG